MKRDRKIRLSIKRETLRRLASNDLEQVAGGKLGVRCTYEQTGCRQPETETCECGGTIDCTVAGGE